MLYKNMIVDLEFGELKTPEMVYYDIITYILQNINTKADNNERVVVHPINYYKYCNYTSKPYTYTSDIELSTDIRLNFYLSCKRSYIGIYKMCVEDTNTKTDTDVDTDFAKLQYLLLIYCDKIFLKYRLHDFVYDLVKM
jgi:hypothetical protein